MAEAQTTLLEVDATAPSTRRTTSKGIGPGDIVETLLRGDADLGIATEAVDGATGLQTFPCFTWEHVAIAPPGHPDSAVTRGPVGPIAQGDSQHLRRPLLQSGASAAGRLYADDRAPGRRLTL